MAGEDEHSLDASDAAQRRTLLWVLGINFTQFLVAGVVGLVAQSTGLLGAALDNLGDALVYAASLYAVGRTVVAKSRVATFSGVLLLALSVGLLAEAARRFFSGSEPIGLAMIITSILNAGTNLVNLRLLGAHRGSGVNLKASWVFTSNDMITNLGIAASGAAVMLLDSSLPDLVIGIVISIVVARGGWKILAEARRARRRGTRDDRSG